MNSKKLPTTWWITALTVLLSTSTALAKDADKKKKDAASEHKGGMMEEGGKDPAATETLDEDGAFVPGKKKKAARGEGEEGEGEGEASAGEGGKGEEQAKPEEKKPEKKPPKARKTLGVFGEALIGFGSAPVPGQGADPSTGPSTSFGFLVGGHYDLTTSLRLILRMPWTTGTVKDQANKDISSNALGAPEMAARYRVTDPGDTELAVKLAVGIPVAQGNPDPTNVKDAGARAQGNLQRVADAASGWHDPELFAPKRVPVTPSVTLSHHADEFRLGGEFKAVFLPKMGGSIAVPNNTTGGTFEQKSMGLSFLLGGSAGYEFMEKKFLALAAWAVYRASDTVEFTSSATAPSRLQFVIEPKLLAQFGHFVPAVGFLIPLGGPLGSIHGLRVHIDAVF